MRKLLKILLVIFLIAVLGLEVYFAFFNNEKKKEEKNTNEIEEKEKDTEHLVDIYTGYNNDNLTITKDQLGNNIECIIISGLKDKKVEEIVNNKIKEKVNALKDKIPSDESLNCFVYSNFENTLSITIETTFNGYYTIGALNFDLTTGNEIKIEDVVNDTDALRIELLASTYEDLSRKAGSIYMYPDLLNQDFSAVEDEQLQLAMKFNKGEYSFSYSPLTLRIFFDDVKIKNINLCDEDISGCYKARLKTDEDVYLRDDYMNNYEAYISLINLKDNLLIYDKFKTKESIYEKDSIKEPVKFYENNDEWEVNEFIKTDKYLIDYSVRSHNKDTNGIREKSKNNLIKEMLVNSDKFSVYDVFGDYQTIEYYDFDLDKSVELYNYIDFNVYQYDMSLDTFEKYKEKIYLNKPTKIRNLEWYDYSTKEYKTYLFLKEITPKRRYFYYIYDMKGNLVNPKNVINRENISSIIPEEWYSLGKYKNSDDLLDSIMIVSHAPSKYQNNLVLNIEENTLEYMGKRINYVLEIKELFK